MEGAGRQVKCVVCTVGEHASKRRSLPSSSLSTADRLGIRWLHFVAAHWPVACDSTAINN